MKFTFVVIGTSLLIIGLIAYSTIPNFHTLMVQSKQPIAGPVNIPIGPSSESETPENVTLVRGGENRLVVNLTVSLASGPLASIRFKLFNSTELGSCMRNVNPMGCLVDQNVSNQTLTVPLNASTTYDFGFDNNDHNASRIVLLSVALFSTSTIILVARDGSFNFAALGLGAFGVLVAAYGAATKTVIPWE